jgi:hypothetical protein
MQGAAQTSEVLPPRVRHGTIELASWRFARLCTIAFLGVSAVALTIAMRRSIHRERSVTIRDRRNADNMHFMIAQYH